MSLPSTFFFATFLFLTDDDVSIKVKVAMVICLLFTILNVLKEIIQVSVHFPGEGLKFREAYNWSEYNE